MGRPQRTDDGAFSYRVMNRWQLQGAIGRPGAAVHGGAGCRRLPVIP